MYIKKQNGLQLTWREYFEKNWNFPLTFFCPSHHQDHLVPFCPPRRQDWLLPYLAIMEKELLWLFLWTISLVKIIFLSQNYVTCDLNDEKSHGNSCFRACIIMCGWSVRHHQINILLFLWLDLLLRGNRFVGTVVYPATPINPHLPQKIIYL